MKTYTPILLLLSLAISASAQQVNVLTMGDWGAGAPAQREVAADMKRYVADGKSKIDAMLLAGDNFLLPLEGGIHDPKWKSLFEDLYDPQVIDFPFYATMGN